MKKRILLGLITFLFCQYLFGQQTIVKGDALTLTFDAEAYPVSVKDADGNELLKSGKSMGFYLLEMDKTKRHFDKVEEVALNEYRFSMSGSEEQIIVRFAPKKHYTTLTFTALENFPLKGERLFFNLNTENQGVQTLALDYMMYTDRRKRNKVEAERRSLWETSDSNPLGAFALYPFTDGEQEDEVLLDIWVNEGLPHPAVKGEWTKAKAEQWLEDWIETCYDVSFINIAPQDFNQHYDFIEYAEMMEAKGLYLHQNIWKDKTVDGVNTGMYMNGLAEFYEFKSELQEDGMWLASHRMSGALDNTDSDYCSGVKEVNEGVEHWGKMKLKEGVSSSDKSIVVIPNEGVVLPSHFKGKGRPTLPPPVMQSYFKYTTFRVGNEWLEAKEIKDLGDGTWELTDLKRAKFETDANGYPAGTEVTGYIRGYGHVFEPDVNSKLLDEVAQRWSEINNTMEFSNASFDGAAWHMAKGVWGFEKFAALTYQYLDHPTWSVTSHGTPPEAWLEYRFNRVKNAFGGEYMIKDAVRYFLGNPSRITPSIEELEYQFLDQLINNSRTFSLARGTKGISIEDLEKNGHIEEVLTTLANYKNASLGMSPEQREKMDVRRKINKAKLPLSGNKPVGTALWSLEGDQFRKWYSTGTKHYTHEWFIGQEHGCVTPRFYTQLNTEESLFVPKEIKTGFDQVRIIGRVLPKFNPSSKHNIELFPLMKIEDKINLIRENNTAQESYALLALKEYKIEKTDLVKHRGIGLHVTGDGSGATVIVRIGDGHLARDYAIPIDFEGKKWIEIPTGEQGWRLNNWSWCPKTKKMMKYEKVSSISVGLGYVPANTKANIIIEDLKALSEIEETVKSPKITVGDQIIKIKEDIPTGSNFTLNANGTFTIFDEYWHAIQTLNLGKLKPSSLDKFSMTSKSSDEIWLEIGVQASTETLPNPAATK
ncbi:hypothetical protein [Flammeovirga sp. EKP202]|uniref:hypothetical protein n=1 Tax=Flammeovirga sp. EKP202 TaxID=2770592 RepID=UPI00165F3A02|nr:hypothetical protein [Flammeovirga sp. EKP202]MBD0400597.1 hypothetical protein [Flammeovirga sp. EKP202]